MSKIILNEIDRYNMLLDYNGWHVVQKSKFNSMLRSLNYKQYTDKEDIIMEFYMCTVENNSKFYSWNGVFTGLMNYMKGVYNKLNIEYQPYDKFLYHEHIPEKMAYYDFLTHTDKKFIAMLMCERSHLEQHGNIQNKYIVKLAQKFGIEDLMCVKGYKDSDAKSRGVYRYTLSRDRVGIIKYINGIILTLYPLCDILLLSNNCKNYIKHIRIYRNSKNKNDYSFKELYDENGKIKNHLELKYSKQCLYEIVDNLL